MKTQLKKLFTSNEDWSDNNSSGIILVIGGLAAVFTTICMAMSFINS